MFLDTDEAAEAFGVYMRSPRRRPCHEPHHAGLDPADPGELRRPHGKPCIDGLSGPGAHQLAEMIRAYWRERGHLVDVRVEPFTGPTSGWAVRSNIGPAGLP